MAYKELNTDELIEINSVSSFISAVKNLYENADGTSTELYFRGQEAEFWDIEPSIFRNSMLSVEHKLMQIPLQKIPMEFKGFETSFDIMTKYQHYGMCTRLLDLTTNPLVALYFACKTHGDEEYIIEEDSTEKVELQEPYGVIYYTSSYYPSQSTDKEVKIISALASYDMSKENTISEILERLHKDSIIDLDTKNRWLTKENVQEFIDIIQNNYIVVPTYTNERLRKQSGLFLLSSSFSVVPAEKIGSFAISKSKGSLRKEFEDTFFYISGENKKEIIKELDLYNINEATLFPELEHQLSYIKSVNENQVQAVDDFTKYESGMKVKSNAEFVDENTLNNYILSNFDNIFISIVDKEDADELKSILKNSFVVDWYKRDTVISKIRRTILGYYYAKHNNKVDAKNISTEITKTLITETEKFISNNEGSE